MRITEQGFQNRTDLGRLHSNLFPHFFRFFNHQFNVSLPNFYLHLPASDDCAVLWLCGRLHTPTMHRLKRLSSAGCSHLCRVALEKALSLIMDMTSKLAFRLKSVECRAMSESNGAAGAVSSRKQQKRLRVIGILVLFLGLVCAGAIYWTGTHSTEPSEDELLPGNARAESHQMELLYGKMGLLTMELSDDLKQPGTQALLIAIGSVLAAAGCFYFARLMDDDTENCRRN